MKYVCIAALLLVAGCSSVVKFNDGSVAENENDYYHAGKILSEEGRFKEALASLEQAARMRDGDDPEHDVEIAFCHMRLGFTARSEADRTRHYQLGIEHARRAIEHRGELTAPWAMSGFMHLELGDVAASTREYEQAVSMDPTDAKLHWNLGEAYLAGGNIAAARDSYAKAALIDQDYAERAEAKLGELR